VAAHAVVARRGIDPPGAERHVRAVGRERADGRSADARAATRDHGPSAAEIDLHRQRRRKYGMTCSPHCRIVSRHAACGTVPIWMRHMISSAPASMRRSTYAIAFDGSPYACSALKIAVALGVYGMLASCSRATRTSASACMPATLSASAVSTAGGGPPPYQWVIASAKNRWPRAPI